MADQSYRRGSRDRYDRDRQDRERNYSRQAEQLDTTDRGWLNQDRNFSQFGDSWRDDEYDRSGQPDGGYGRGWNQPGERHGSESRRYGRGGHRDTAGRFDSFTGDDFGGSRFGAGTKLAAARGEWRERPDWNETEERGWFDRASDEVASWFGDEAASRRRELYDHRGRGPAGYTRSDERILDDVNDELTEDWGIDASKVQVSVSGGEVTLDGSVPTRWQKRRAEDCVEDLSGVRHVQNNLRVHETRALDRSSGTEKTSS